jgi:predicted metal-dependent peptidase
LFPNLGSSSGEIKIWAIAPNLKSFTHLFDIEANGFVNSLQLLAVPPRNVQPEKWIDEKTRKAQTEKKRQEKKERRRVKRHGTTSGVDANMEVANAADDVSEAEAEVDGVNGPSQSNGKGIAINRRKDKDSEDEESDDDMSDSEDEAVAKLKRRLAPAKVDPEILLFASLAREPRLGRWEVLKDRGVKNGTLVVHLGRQTL